MAETVIYISGKMTGEPDLGRAKFEKVEKRLRERGMKVLNPAMLPTDLPPEKYMPICMAMIDQADAFLLLDDWQESKGAKIERLYAKYQGKRIIYPGKKKERKNDEGDE